MSNSNGQLVPLDLGSLKPWVIECELEIEGTKQRFLLREPSEGAVTEYRRATMRGITYDQGEGKVTGVEGSADAEPQLVAACFFQVKKKESGSEYEVQVTERELRSWPGRIAKTLFDEIQARCPWLMGEETEEGLEKDIAAKTKRLEKLRKAREKGEAAEGTAKNSPQLTTTT